MKNRMPDVLFCNVHECSYNDHDACHALAITVDSNEPLCDTFFKSSKKGGVKNTTGGVGACKSSTCVHNESLECTASGIKIAKHDNKAECGTYQHA